MPNGPIMQKGEELKPCPFCGSSAEYERRGTRRQSCIVACTNCGARHESGDEEFGPPSWNQRVTPSPEPMNQRVTPSPEPKTAASSERTIRSYLVEFSDGSSVRCGVGRAVPGSGYTDGLSNWEIAEACKQLIAMGTRYMPPNAAPGNTWLEKTEAAAEEAREKCWCSGVHPHPRGFVCKSPCKTCLDDGFVVGEDHDPSCDGSCTSARCPIPVQLPCPDCSLASAPAVSEGERVCACGLDHDTRLPAQAAPIQGRLLRANSLLRSALSIADRQGAQTNWKAFRDRIAEELGLQHPITGPLWATTDMPTPDYMTNPPSSDGLQEIARELLRLYDWRNEVGAAITDEQARKYGREKKAAWTRLREVLSTSAPEGEDARFKVGDVVRYDDGQTALFRIDSISEKHDGRHDRFYGEQCMGGSVGAYSSECRPASGEDLKTWAANLGWREAARASEESKS